MALNFEQSLYADMVSAGSITTLVGTRIYPIWRTQEGAYPALIYDVDREPIQYQGSDTGMTTALVQFAAIAKHFSDAKAINEQVISRYQNLVGTMGGVEVKAVNTLSEAMDYQDLDRTYFHITEFEFVFIE